MQLKLSIFLFLVVILATVQISSTESVSDTQAVLRKLLETEKLCEKQKSNFQPGQERTLSSPTCTGRTILKKCNCSSDDKKVTVIDVKENVNKGLCKCTFANGGKKAKEGVKIKTCAVCEILQDECTVNADCTEYGFPICDRDVVPRVCVQCKRNSQCSAGETCVNNTCV